EAARRGIGIALLPEFACKEDLQAGRLRQVLSEWSSGERPLYALYPTPRHLSREGVAFIDMLSAGLRATHPKTSPDLVKKCSSGPGPRPEQATPVPDAPFVRANGETRAGVSLPAMTRFVRAIEPRESEHRLPPKVRLALQPTPRPCTAGGASIQAQRRTGGRRRVRGDPFQFLRAAKGRIDPAEIGLDDSINVNWASRGA